MVDAVALSAAADLAVELGGVAALELEALVVNAGATFRCAARAGAVGGGDGTPQAYPAAAVAGRCRRVLRRFPSSSRSRTFAEDVARG